MFKRRADLTHEQFREYYETKHAVLSLKLYPYFKDYRRNYIDQDQLPAKIEGHTTSTLNYDVITEITLHCRADYDRLVRDVMDPVIGKQVIEDEERFMDRSAHLVFRVDEEVSTIPVTIASSIDQAASVPRRE